MNKVTQAVRRLQSFADRPWYPPLVGLLALLDNFILVIPNDGILISSAMLTPRRWLTLAFLVAVGSTLGAMLLAGLVEWQGLPFILERFPGLDESRSWVLTARFFDRYGLALVFVVAVTPFVQQPAVILAALAKTPIHELALVIFAGRFIKFLIMAYAGSHAPGLLRRMWGTRGELEEVGLKLR